jgi:GR25 family glycosyltransferase involved in LPS biosynthesis
MVSGTKKGYIIHLESCTEREQYVTTLQTIFPQPLEIFPASDGSEWFTNPSIPNKHPMTGDAITKGNMGCTHSHIQILKRCIQDNVHEVTIFEDDCEFLTQSANIQSFLQSVQSLPWDILLLGGDYVKSKPYPIKKETGAHTLLQIKQFWGTHAIVIRASAFQACIDALEDSFKKGIFLPADWMYNKTITRSSLLVLAPPHRSLSRQAPNLRSCINGNIRV